MYANAPHRKAMVEQSKHQHILEVPDHCTRFAKANPNKKQTARNTAKILII